MELKKLDRRFFFPPLLLLILLAAQPGFADAVFTLGNHPEAGEQNILLDNGATGSLVTGITNTTNTLVAFSSTTDTLINTASGQAVLTADDGWINNIKIYLPGGGTSLDMILDPVIPSNIHVTVPVDVLVEMNDKSIYPFSYDLGNGENFLTITAINGETILSTTINSTPGFESLKHPRISGVSGGETAVPEPTSLLLLGTGLSVIGIAAWRRRK